MQPLVPREVGKTSAFFCLPGISYSLSPPISIKYMDCYHPSDFPRLYLNLAPRSFPAGSKITFLPICLSMLNSSGAC